MSGQLKLRITSSRTPYRRAGLAFPAREPVELDFLKDRLQRDQFQQLYHDPVLTVALSTGGPWHSVAEVLDGALGDALAQLIRDALSTPASQLEPANAGEADFSGYTDAGIDTELAELRERNDRQAETIGKMETEIKRQAQLLDDRDAEIARLKEVLSRAASPGGAAAAKPPKAAKSTVPKTANTPPPEDR